MGSSRIALILPAAGIGRRMGGTLPKQYLPLAGRTVIEWSLEPFLARDDIGTIVVAIAPQDREFAKLPVARHPRIRMTEGGTERSDSVLNGLKALAAASDDWVLVHDAARPCLDEEDLAKLIETASNDSVGGLLAAPVADTLKSATAGRALSTVSREGLWRALTPQMFRFGVLQDALVKAAREGYAVTDEASAIEAIGLHPRLVVGRSDNLKITVSEDIGLAEYVLQARSKV